MRTIYPKLLMRRKANQEELVPGTMILKSAAQDLDEREGLIVASNSKSEVAPGDIVFIINQDGENLKDHDDPYLEEVDERNVLGVIENGSLRPIRDKVLAKLIDVEEKTTEGIILPDTARTRTRHYEVVAVGPGKLKEDGSREPVEASPGDKIVIDQYSGIKFDKEHIVLPDSDILAVLESVHA